jgi:hypothetical protein
MPYKFHSIAPLLIESKEISLMVLPTIFVPGVVGAKNLKHETKDMKLSYVGSRITPRQIIKKLRYY